MHPKLQQRNKSCIQTANIRTATFSADLRDIFFNLDIRSCGIRADVGYDTIEHTIPHPLQRQSQNLLKGEGGGNGEYKFDPVALAQY